MTRLPFELFLGFRYLKPKRTFVSVITLISLAGVAIGVWVLIAVIAVMSGFDRELRHKLVGMNAHVTVSAAGGLVDRPQQETITRAAQGLPGVKAVSPYVLGLVLVEFDRHVATPYVKGVEPQREVKGIHVRMGALDLTGEKVVIGTELAHQLGVFLGDKLTVYSPRNLEKRGEEVYLPAELEVAGIFESGMFEYDIGLMFTSLETAQDLYEMGNAVHGVEVMTDDPLNGAIEVARELNRALRPPLRAQTWAELNGKLLGAIATEKRMMFLIVLIITVVAAFSIMNTLIVVAVQRTREIGVLKALGATPGRLLLIFLMQGVVIGAIGTMLGVGLGWLTVANVNAIADFLFRVFQWEVFPRQIYEFSEIPASLSGRDLLTIAVSAFAICTLAGLFPAWWASRLEPVEALRYE